MPYQGMSLSIEEMLDVLTSRERTEAAAVLELERAFEDEAILLLLADESNADGEILYRKLSSAEISAVIMLLRDLPNRMRIPSMRALNAPIALFRAARAMRPQFEARCGLVDQSKVYVAPAGPMARKDAVRACMEGGMMPGSTVTWKVFCERVRDLADGWIDKKRGTLKRRFDEKTIQRDVKEIMN